jgi:predicted ATPase
LLEQIVARADGMPLYLEELTKTLLEAGAAWNVEAIPASLADSLMGRLDRLSVAKDRAREVAQRAAVLGREFGYPLLAAMVGMDEAALRQGLARLVDAEILFARGEPPAATYTFKHALIQETAYQSQLKRTRQQLHARIAQVLEERFPERVAAEPEVIARHYDQAGLAAQASAHYQRAGERATQRSANEEAIGHLRRALDLVATLPETRERVDAKALLAALGGAAPGASRQRLAQDSMAAGADTPKKRPSAVPISARAAAADRITSTDGTDVCIWPRQGRWRASTPAAAKAAAYAAPSSRSGSNSQVTTSAGGRLDRSAARSGDALGRCRSAGSA